MKVPTRIMGFAAATAVTLGTVAVTVPSAEARSYRYDRSDSYRGYHDRYRSYDRGRNRGYDRDRAGYRCGNDGTTGTIIGAVAGGLLGNGIAGRGDRTTGTILGGAVGALAGRAIERGGNRC